MEQFNIILKLCEEIQNHKIINFMNDEKKNSLQTSIAIIFRFSPSLNFIFPKTEGDSFFLEKKDLNQIFELINLNNNDKISKALNLFEILFLQRVINEKDRFSGHICLPGGKCDENENDFDAVLREINEEIGINFLENKKNIKYIGKSPLNIVHAYYKNKLYCVSIHFFISFTHLDIKINLNEIQNYKWIQFKDFLYVDQNKFKILENKIDALDYLKFFTNSEKIKEIKKYFKSSLYMSLDIGMNNNLWGLSLAIMYHFLGIIKKGVENCSDEFVKKELNKNNFYEKINDFAFCCSYKKMIFNDKDNKYVIWGKILDFYYYWINNFDYSYFNKDLKYKDPFLYQILMNNLFKYLILSPYKSKL